MTKERNDGHIELEYCPNLKLTLGRLRELYVDRREDIVLAKMRVPSKTLTDFRSTHLDGFCHEPDIEERLGFWDALNQERISVFDDAVPTAYLSEFDQGLYGHLIGGEVRYLCNTSTGWISSMVPPILGEISELSTIEFQIDNNICAEYIGRLKRYAEASRGKYGISHFIMINGFNFIFELIGATATYMAADEKADLVREAMEFALEINIKIQQTFFENIPLIHDGTCSNMAQWIPGRIVSESVDPFHMTSVDYFEKWGRESIERILSEFDGGVIHIHSNGRHLLPAVSSIRGLKAIRLQDDDNETDAFEIIEEMKCIVGDMPLICFADYPSFRKKLSNNELPGGVFYEVKDVPDIDSANKCMDLVRQYHR